MVEKNASDSGKTSSDVQFISTEHISKNALRVLYTLSEAGYEAHLVGGGVRDILLGSQPKDFDIATNARPEEVRALFSRSRLIGRRFRLVHVYFGRDFIEVATFRAAPNNDSPHGVTADDGRIVHDNVYGTLDEDAQRRDFTINALFYDIKTGKVLDKVGGLNDLQAGLLRLIGDPDIRYREDPVRILRAIRFAAKLDFKIEDSADQAIFKYGHLLAHIAPARLFDECLKLFHSGQAVRTFKLLRHYDVFKYLFPLTEKMLHENDDEGLFLTFINTALNNSDKRIQSGKSVTPAFLLAVMLWGWLKERIPYYQMQGFPDQQSWQQAASDAVRTQAKTIAVPRRFSNATREIWGLQLRFQRKDCRRALAFLSYPRFRASYDFFCLRAKAGEIDPTDCQWWTEFQDASMKHQQEMCKSMRSKKKRRRKKK